MRDRVNNLFKKGIKKIIKSFGLVGSSMLSYKQTNLFEATKFYNTKIQTVVDDAKKYQGQQLETVRPKEELGDFRIVTSPLDSLGNVLIKTELDGTKKFYRGIPFDKVVQFKDLYSCGVLQALSEAGYVVKIHSTNLYTKEYPLIVEMEALCCVPPNCWSFSMIKESAINMLVINAVLKVFGYTLQDGHALNMAFQQNKPIFFDLGSFVKNPDELFVEEYIDNYLYTLLMLHFKDSFFAKHYICGYERRNLPLPVRLACSIEAKTMRKIFFRHHTRHSSREYNKVLQKTFVQKELKPEYVEVLFSKYPSFESAWKNYSCELFQQEPSKRFTRFIELMGQFSSDAKSCLDLAGNSGYVSSLLGKTGRYKSLINVDYDENAIEYGRQHLVNEGIDFYLLDFMLPWGSIDSIAPALASDIVLVLAVTHHLILTQGYNIRAIFSIIAMYSKKYVYIEFCPLGMYSTDNPNVPAVPDWYTEEWFEENFKKQFALLHKEVLSSVRINGVDKNHRVLFVGQKMADIPHCCTATTN
ncbi:putative methyltransferase [Candidatus Termititenax aidoneus]|uniref:Methyltransferase n=1 Tax=Termititenax aidoneus TaxID=2218524 RepID=A0A388TCC3_TERA1|nr:putative methyltransferase [Candidatus Termititenax aidoneus]